MLSANCGSQTVLTLAAAVLRVTTLARLEIRVLNLNINSIIEVLTRAKGNM
jgi:hypothetical protein